MFSTLSEVKRSRHKIEPRFYDRPPCGLGCVMPPSSSPMELDAIGGLTSHCTHQGIKIGDSTRKTCPPVVRKASPFEPQRIRLPGVPVTPGIFSLSGSYRVFRSNARMLHVQEHPSLVRENTQPIVASSLTRLLNVVGREKLLTTVRASGSMPRLVVVYRSRTNSHHARIR